MNTIMDTDTDGAIRLACSRQNYKAISRLAMSAIDGLLDRGFYGCFGSIDYPSAQEYAEKLLESGELKYELAEHCVAEGIVYSSAAPHYSFKYSMRCKRFADDAWHAGISPAIYTKATCLLSDGDAPVPGTFGTEGRRMLLPLYSVGARPRRDGGAEVSFEIPVSTFASMLPIDRYMELLHAVHRYSVQPQVQCLCLLFNDEGIKKLCRRCVENIMKGYAGEDAKAEETGQVDVSVVQDNPIRELPGSIGCKPDKDVTVVYNHGTAEAPTSNEVCRRESQSADPYIEQMEETWERWEFCLRDLEAAGISSKTRPEGLYKVLPGECLDLFVAGDVTGLISPCCGKLLDFGALRGDRRTVKADRGQEIYVFVKGHHVAVRHFCKDGDSSESAVLAEQLPSREYVVECSERTMSGTEGREMQCSRGVVWVDLRFNDTGTMVDQYSRTELKPGTYRVYGSDDMYSMVDATRKGRSVIPIDKAVENGLVTEKEADRIRRKCSDTEEPVLIKD